jgi:hypothetical protein
MAYLSAVMLIISYIISRSGWRQACLKVREYVQTAGAIANVRVYISL